MGTELSITVTTRELNLVDNVLPGASRFNVKTAVANVRCN